jgi:hypothetical protein
MRAMLRRFRRQDGRIPTWLLLVVLVTCPVWGSVIIVWGLVSMPVVVVCDYVGCRAPRWCFDPI